MKILFNRNNSIGTLCLLLLLAAVAGACVKDEYAEKEKATVQVTFMTRAVSDGTIAGNELADNERMKTLRVIVTKDGKILYNEYYTENDFAENGNGQRYKTVTFSELVTEDEADRTFVFYAIANEEGTGYNDWASISIETLESRKIRQSFGSSSLIPQTVKKEIKVEIPQKDSGIQKETMQLEFVVAKVQLIVVNESETEQTLTNISLSNADVKNPQVPLFPSKQSVLSVGDKNVTMSEMTLNGYETSAQTAYVYENKAPTTVGYVFNATWKNNSQPPVDLSTVEALPRGKELRITIHLKQNSTAQFDYEVLDWTNVRVDIPDFE